MNEKKDLGTMTTGATERESRLAGTEQVKEVGAAFDRAMDGIEGSLTKLNAEIDNTIAEHGMMLAALKAVRDDMYHHTRESRPRTALIRVDALRQVMAAIAKAEGR